ncbi:ADP-heptose synthase [Tumebacillus algifaecis]|uniref:ADP-heptose synthase n=1 Tax=Tumebacillus algifaecis TaxID=1214604 RepID=UPI00187E5A7F|nr:ADP-heptose synthase [Tumebacillus algifaecis]
MQRFVVEPILFAMFGELLFPTEPIEYIIPYSTVMELYELRESDEVISDPRENERVKANLEKVILFFEQPFVAKKLDKALRMPWQKSRPILFNENVTFTVVNAFENAEFGEGFDPVETELILVARREKVPLITDQLQLQQRIVEARIDITVLDVADFGFLVDEPGLEELALEDDPVLVQAPVNTFEAQDGALSASEERAIEPTSNRMLPWVLGGFGLILVLFVISLIQ